MDIKATPQHNRFRRIGLPLIVGLIIVAVFGLVGVYAANQRSTAPDPFAPYDPVTFGIPEVVAGYRILAVQTADNTVCTKPGVKSLVIQAVDPSPDNPMVPREGGDILGELKKLEPNTEWELTYTMPFPLDRGKFLMLIENHNQSTQHDCISLSGPIVSLTPDPYAPYAPVTFGIPDTIAGYEVLAVLTSDNTTCMRSGVKRLVLRTVSSFEAFHNDNDPDAVIQALKLLGKSQEFGGIEYVGSDISKEQIIALNEDWNEQNRKVGCPNFGGPILNVSADRFAPYAPATYGLPEIVAGYRIITVQTSSNTPCMAVNQIRLTIQVVDPSPDNPMVDRNGGDIIFEVKKLHPDIDWQLQYVMPQPVTQADHERFLASMEDWRKAGCITLGGPQFTVMPSATP